MKKNKLFPFLLLSFVLITSCDQNVKYLDVEFESENDIQEEFLDESLKNSFQKLYENENFVFSFKDEIDILQIYDKKANYTWKSGIDSPLYDLESYYDLSRNERKEFVKNYPSIEGDMTKVYIALANSLMTVEVFVKAGSNYTTTYLPSGLNDGIESTIKKVSGQDNKFKFIVDYNKYASNPFDIQITADLVFEDDGYDIGIKNVNIKGNDANYIKNILITPYLGATGGVKYYYEEENKDYAQTPTDNEIQEGYALIPDGSGAIINFTNNNVKNLTPYIGKVYGEDYSRRTNYEKVENGLTGIKNPTIPVYGVAFSNDKVGFVCYGTKGEEYETINYLPDNYGSIQYNRVFPSFEYNLEYTQIYNNAGEGYSTIMENRNQYDFSLHYSYLNNDAASYVGMALNYRNYLLSKNTLQIKDNKNEDISIRLDFLMSDTKNATIGDSNVIVTKAKDVSSILKEVKNENINNVVSSLSGWQGKGKATQNPSKANFSSKIGTAKEFQNLIEENKNMNYDISFSENYFLINNKQMAFLNNASKHYNGYYNRYYNENLNFQQSFGYLLPTKSYEFVKKQNQAISKKVNINSMTIDGISNNLISHYNLISRSLSKAYIDSSFKYLKGQNLLINAYSPNGYLYSYIDRYFDMDMQNSSLLIENKSVPFLSLVLNNTMEIYSPYSNFSFYDNDAILKMIDYNVYPSFILTNDSSYALNNTNSCSYYSTQYATHKELIISMYNSINSALSNVNNSSWENREEINTDVYVNHYSNGKKIIINYSNSDITYQGKLIKKTSWEVI